MKNEFIRVDRRAREAAEARLSPAATRSAASGERPRPETPDPDRTCFELDRDRILHSKAFRRLKHKTQVFVHPEGDHYVTRLTHTIAVTQIARALAAGLGLNEALTEAIALGHDVGHPPFGHVGEAALAPYFPEGWHHAAQSVRIFTVLEDRNLTRETRDGIRGHTWRIEPPPATPEGACVRFADRIAYLTHDALDAQRAGLLAARDFPAAVRSQLGPPGGGWIGTLVDGVLDETVAAGVVTMRPDLLVVMHELRDFMFERVYGAAHDRAQKQAAASVICRLFEHHLAHPDALPASYLDTEAPVPVQVADYVAGMTDRYALGLHERLFGPLVPAA